MLLFDKSLDTIIFVIIYLFRFLPYKLDNYDFEISGCIDTLNIYIYVCICKYQCMNILLQTMELVVTNLLATYSRDKG